MKMTIVLAAALAAIGPTCRAQTLESAEQGWKEVIAQQKLAAARAELARSAVLVHEYAAAVAALTPKIAALDAEAAQKESFDLHWGGSELYEVSRLLSYNLPNMDGVIDANVHWRPHTAWWGIWAAHRAKYALKDPEFRANARRTVAELDGALREIDALEAAMLKLYRTLWNKHAHEVGIVFGTDMRMQEIAYRRADFRKMRVQAAAFADGKRARMKNPADWD